MVENLLLLRLQGTVKNGRRNGKQFYKCKSCERQFVGGKRLSEEQLKTEYIEGKQTFTQLAQKYTIWRRIKSMCHI